MRACERVALDVGMTVRDFIRVEDNASAELLDGIVQGQLDRTMVLDYGHLGPRGAFPGQHRCLHEIDGRVGQHAREVGVGYLWENSDVAGVLLTEDGDGFGDEIWKYAKVHESMHPM